MVKISAAVRPPEGADWAGLARRMAGLGFRGLSLPFDPRWTDEQLIAIRAALDRQGAEVVGLACECNFLTPLEEANRSNFVFLGRALAAGAILNCDHVVTHAGSRHPDPTQPLAPHPDNWADSTWDLLVRRAWALLDETEDVGVRLCFEPHPATTLNTLDSLASLMADVATVRVRVALDPAAILSPEAASEPKRALAEIFSTLADAIAVARATDVRLVQIGDEPLTEPAPLGEGVLDYGTYLKLISALDLDTPLIVPLQDSDAAYRKAHDFLAATARLTKLT